MGLKIQDQQLEVAGTEDKTRPRRRQMKEHNRKSEEDSRLGVLGAAGLSSGFASSHFERDLGWICWFGKSGKICALMKTRK